MNVDCATRQSPSVHAAFRYVDHVFSEIGKISVIGGALQGFAIKNGLKGINYYAVAGAPVVEEILFRGMLNEAVALIQRDWAAYNEKELSQADLKAQKEFRIRLVAVIFGLAHFAGGPIQVTVAAMGGYMLGNLAEETNSLALPIIFHALHNISCVVIGGPAGLACLIIINVSGYWIAKNSGLESLCNKMIA